MKNTHATRNHEHKTSGKIALPLLALFPNFPLFSSKQGHGKKTPQLNLYLKFSNTFSSFPLLLLIPLTWICLLIDGGNEMIEDVDVGGGVWWWRRVVVEACGSGGVW